MAEGFNVSQQGSSTNYTYSPSVSNSAASVQSVPSFSADYLGGLGNILDNAYSNTAQSMAEADKLRNWQVQQNKIAMDFNQREAAKNRDWQEYMSNTAHQREVSDLIAAGLNPVLSAGGGNGAHVGSGASAQGVTSSGGQGDVDTSGNMAMSNMLATMLAAEVQLRNKDIDARTQQAVADTYTAQQQTIAELQNIVAHRGLDLDERGLAQHRDLTMQQIAAMIYGSTVSSRALTSAAGISAAASRYGSDNALAASMYGADKSSAASMYGADKSSAASMYGADKSSGASVYGTDVRADVAEKDRAQRLISSLMGMFNFGVKFN